MWDEQKQNRLIELLAAKERSALSKSESKELQKLSAERLQFETESLTGLTHNMDAKTEEYRVTVQEVEAQKLAFEKMIREQEEYLADVNALVAEIEKRRRNWRKRYKRLTGQSLEEPIVLASVR